MRCAMALLSGTAALQLPGEEQLWLLLFERQSKLKCTEWLELLICALTQLRGPSDIHLQLNYSTAIAAVFANESLVMDSRFSRAVSAAHLSALEQLGDALNSDHARPLLRLPGFLALRRCSLPLPGLLLLLQLALLLYWLLLPL